MIGHVAKGNLIREWEEVSLNLERGLQSRWLKFQPQG